MNNKFIEKTKKLLAGFIITAIILTMLPQIPTFAKTGTTIYSYDNYDIEYSVLNEWNNGQSVEVKVTNTGNDSIMNWALKYNAKGEINNLWNATIYDCQEEDYIIKNAGWNYQIAPGQTVNFGYTLTNDNFVTPDNFQLCSKRINVSSGYETTLNIVEQWNTGMKAELIITNTSDKPLEAWTFSFDSNFIINDLWGGHILESTDNHYTVASEMWTNPIPVGGSTTIGFVATKSLETEAEINNLLLTSVIIDDTLQSDAPNIPQELEAIIAFGTYDKQSHSIILEWFYKDNIGDFNIYEISNTKELVAKVTDDSIYYFEVDDKVDEYVFTIENDSFISNEVIMKSDGNGSYEFIIDIDETFTDTIYDNSITDIQILNIDEYYPLEVEFNTDETQVVSISGKFSDITVASPIDALYSIYSVKTLLGLENPMKQLKFDKFNHSESGLTYTFVQYHNGIQVLASSVTVSVDISGKPVSLSSTIMNNDIINGISSVPNLSTDDINNIIQTKYVQAEYSEMKIYYTALVIYCEQYAINPKLVYISIVSDESNNCKTIIIDANTGDILKEYSNIKNEMVMSSGTDEYEKTVSFPVNKRVEYPVAEHYTMEDVDRNIYIYDKSLNESKYTYKIDLPITSGSTKDIVWSDKVAISTYTNVIKAYDWWKAKFNYRGLNGKKGYVEVYVHDTDYEDNARYYYYIVGEDLSFGDSKLTKFSKGSDLSCVGHEYTHAVFRHKIDAFMGITCNKIDSVNEAYADIFGSFINNNTWRTSPRNIAMPEATSNPKYADKSIDKFYDANFEGVHNNSTIISHAAYLMQTKYKIAFDKLYTLWYDSLSEGFGTFSDFNTVRTNVTKSARKNNFTLSEISNIKKAFDDVGVLANKGSVKIIVLNGKEKIDSAKLTLSNYGTNKIAYITSDNPGEVIITDLEVGTHAIKVEIPGHAPIFANVLIKKDKTVKKTIKLSLSDIDGCIYDHYNYPELYSVSLPNHITITDNSIKMTGYSVAPLKDFVLINDSISSDFKEVRLSFNIKRDSNNWHTMEGGGFLFNASVSKKNILKGYCMLLTQQGLRLYYINGIDVDKFRNGQIGNIYIVGKLLGIYDIGDVLADHEITLRIIGQKITVWDSDKTIIDNYKLPYNTKSYDFGPITSHISHECNQISYFTFSNITMNVISE